MRAQNKEGAAAQRKTRRRSERAGKGGWGTAADGRGLIGRWWCCYKAAKMGAGASQQAGVHKTYIRACADVSTPPLDARPIRGGRAVNSASVSCFCQRALATSEATPTVARSALRRCAKLQTTKQSATSGIGRETFRWSCSIALPYLQKLSPNPTKTFTQRGVRPSSRAERRSGIGGSHLKFPTRPRPWVSAKLPFLSTEAPPCCSSSS